MDAQQRPTAPDARDPYAYDAIGPLSAEADAVVVGGGVAGCSVAYQLAKRGKRVVLLELRGICSGASGRNAGMTGGGSPAPSRVGRAAYALTSENLRLMRDVLPGELGDDFDLRLPGTLDIATSEAMWAEHVASVAVARELDPDASVRLLDGDEVRQLVPAASGAILGAKFVRTSGHLWPLTLVHALANGARRHGAAIFPWTPAQAITTANGAITGVRTARGAVATGTVVLATNAWTPLLLAELSAGALVPARGQILVTQPVGPVLPHTFGTNFDKEYGRQTASGQLLIGGHRRLDQDEGLGHYAERVWLPCVAGNARCLTGLFPKVGPVRVVRAWAGIMGFTADGLPLIGPHDSAAGLYLSAGFNGGGFGWTLAAGQALAQRIADGETAHDLAPFDPNRFARGGVAWENPYTAGEQNNPTDPGRAKAARLRDA